MHAGTVACVARCRTGNRRWREQRLALAVTRTWRPRGRQRRRDAPFSTSSSPVRTATAACSGRKRFSETTSEGVPVGEVHAATMLEHVCEVPRQALGDIQADLRDFVTRMKWTISLPEPSIMPNTVNSGSAGARSLIARRVPCHRTDASPSNGHLVCRRELRRDSPERPAACQNERRSSN